MQDPFEEGKAQQSKTLTQNVGTRAGRSMNSVENTPGTAAAPIPSSI